MKVIEVDDSWQARWDAFVDASPAGSFYHRYPWRAINREEFGHRSFYLAAIDGEQIVGVLPVVRLRSRLFGNLGCSMPFVNFGGPCSASGEVDRVLVEAATGLVARERLDYLEMRNRRRLAGDLPTSEHKVSMTVDLDPDPDVLWARFKTGHRQEIRRGAKHGLVARCGGVELLEPFYRVLAESWRDLGTPLYKKAYFERVLRTFPEHTRLCVAFAGDDPAAAAFDGIHGQTIEGMWMGAREKYRSQLAGYVLYWELIRDACVRGYTRFHLGRSTSESGAEAFKKKWNAYPMPLYWQYLLGRRKALPALRVDNPRYEFAIRAWRRLPLGVTSVVGPLIARSIP
ncbi:MAG: FemAB family PEP-CTERM system-associated protein [Acidobacteria bacterium]|nr:FemAB family PEP-CTERM system-associated protein [Acidobacteriota bacterium]